jgi:aminoglycoside phosphotransferase (APT) family kinase protein
VFLKASDPAHAKLNAATGGALNEPRLFEQDVHLPLEHPAVYHTIIDEPSLGFVLVMEDVTVRGGDPRDATRPLSVDQAADAVAALARLHSTYWGDRIADDPQLAWIQPLTAWGSMARGVDIGIERAGDRIAPTVAALGGEQIDRGYWVSYISTVTDGPLTLLHGDAHIGNTYALPDGTVGFLDWQVVRRGNHCLDLGYFLQGAISVSDRQASETALVRHYHQSLDMPAEDRPSFDNVWLRYRASVAHGLALWLATAASSWQKPEVSLTLAERYAAAFVDLETPDAIHQLTSRP